MIDSKLLTTITIDSDVPVAMYGGVGKNSVFVSPWKDMKDGDSFFLAGADDIVINRLEGHGRNQLKRHNPSLRIVRRKVEGGYRLWTLTKS